MLSAYQRFVPSGIAAGLANAPGLLAAANIPNPSIICRACFFIYGLLLSWLISFSKNKTLNISRKEIAGIYFIINNAIDR